MNLSSIGLRRFQRCRRGKRIVDRVHAIYRRVRETIRSCFVDLIREINTVPGIGCPAFLRRERDVHYPLHIIERTFRAHVRIRLRRDRNHDLFAERLVAFHRRLRAAGSHRHVILRVLARCPRRRGVDEPDFPGYRFIRRVLRRNRRRDQLRRRTAFRLERLGRQLDPALGTRRYRHCVSPFPGSWTVLRQFRRGRVTEPAVPVTQQPAPAIVSASARPTAKPRRAFFLLVLVLCFIIYNLRFLPLAGSFAVFTASASDSKTLRPILSHRLSRVLPTLRRCPNIQTRHVKSGRDCHSLAARLNPGSR